MIRSSPPVLSDESIVSWIMTHMKNRESLMTPVELGKVIRRGTGLEKKKVKSLIYALVSNGELEYVDAFGRTCLTLSFSRPVRVSTRVILKPPDVHYSPNPGDVVVNLNKGIAFGRGTHPTTTLCIRALTWLFDLHSPRVSMGLDIGTGTGVLAVVASLLGAENVLACDIDSIAIHEARENVHLNHQGMRIVVGDTCDFSQTYDLIMANLRYPTLISMHKDIIQSVSHRGWIVLSGIKQNEIEKVVSCYNQGTELLWKETDGGWAALVYKVI